MVIGSKNTKFLICLFSKNLRKIPNQWFQDIQGLKQFYNFKIIKNSFPCSSWMAFDMFCKLNSHLPHLYTVLDVFLWFSFFLLIFAFLDWLSPSLLTETERDYFRDNGCANQSVFFWLRHDRQGTENWWIFC